MSTFLSKILESNPEFQEEQIKYAVLNEALPQLIDRVTAYLSIDINQTLLSAEIKICADKFIKIFEEPSSYLFLIGGTSAPLAGSILRAIAIRITGNDHLVGQMLAPLVLNQQDNKNAYNSFSDPLHRYKSENTLIFFEEVILSGKKLKGFLSKYAKHRFYSFISSIDFRKEIYSWEDLYTLKQISPDITYLSQEQKKCVEIFNISQEKSDLFYLIRRLSLLSNLYYGVLVPILFSELEQENGSLDSSLEAPSFFSQALDKYVPVSSKDISDTVRNNLIEAGKIIDIFQNIILK